LLVSTTDLNEGATRGVYARSGRGNAALGTLEGSWDSIHGLNTVSSARACD